MDAKDRRTLLKVLDGLASSVRNQSEYQVYTDDLEEAEKVDRLARDVIERLNLPVTLRTEFGGKSVVFTSVDD